MSERSLGWDEAERFREDLYLRITRTAMLMSHILDEEASDLLADIQRYEASEFFDEDRAQSEYVKIGDVADHERFVYNWAHVMLSTRVTDALRELTRVEVPAKGIYTQKGEIQKLEAEYEHRFAIKLADAPPGIEFLEGMVLTRNKIVHNGAMLKEATTNPDRISVEGADFYAPGKFDRDFMQRFPRYIDGNRITCTKQTFETNVTKALAFTEWFTERFDSFLLRLTQSTSSTPS